MRIGLLLFTLSFFLQGATWYVRTDGGTPTQCTGLVDAAYPGSGTGQPCGLSHPFWLLTTPTTWRIAGGDTVLITEGSYQMGYGAPGTGAGGIFGVSYATQTRNVHLPTLPAGTSPANPTRLLGKAWDTGCATKPELWGSGGAYHMFKLGEGTSYTALGTENLDIRCLEITDHAECVWAGLPSTDTTYMCNSYPIDQTALWMSWGFYGKYVKNMTIKDLYVHGLAHTAWKAGFFDTLTIQNNVFSGNAVGNFDFDRGGTDNRGITLVDSNEISWGGCIEKYPNDPVITSHCHQIVENNIEGIGTSFTSNTWIVTNNVFAYNAQDGLDLLYLTAAGSTTVSHNEFYGNGGNQLKTSGNAEVFNNRLIGNCSWLADTYGAAFHNSKCRAGGHTISHRLLDGTQGYYYNNSITNGCCPNPTTASSAILATCYSSACSTFTGQVTLQNNVAQNFYTSGTKPTYWQTSDGATTAQLVGWSNNIWYNFRTGCPYGSLVDTNVLCVDPQWINATYSASLDAHLQPTSPARNAGLTIALVTDDIEGTARPQESVYDRGAYEFTSGTITPPTITTTTLPNGIVNVAYSQTLAASGDTPITWAVTAGALCGGLTLSVAGVLSGTPTTVETCKFTVTATNAGGSDPQDLSVAILNPPLVTTTSLPNGTVGTAYSQTLAVSGGTAPFAWTVTAGTLPTGLSLTEATGVVSGTPTVAGAFAFTVRATDSLAAFDEQALSVTVYEAGTLTVTISAGHGTAVVTITGAVPTVSCSVTVERVSNSAEVLGSTTALSGPRIRVVGVTGLPYGMEVTATATCGTKTTTSASVTTLNNPGVSTVTQSLVFPSGSGTVTLQWGVDSLSDNEQTQDCSSGCTFSLSGLSKADVMQFRWKHSTRGSWSRTRWGLIQ